MPEFGKILIVVGLVISGIGIALWLGIGKGWPGRLPGDLHFKGENVSFHFPIVTCILLSLILTLLLRFFWR